jgi:hypothetical protein
VGSSPDEVAEFLNLPNPFSPTTALWLSQPLTEMSTMGSRTRPACKADNLTIICELTV